MKNIFVGIVFLFVFATSVNATVFQSGGGRLVSTQNTDGGWPWPLETGVSASNTLAPIGMGLSQAYLNTGDADQLSALQKTAGFLQSKTNNFSSVDGYLAVQLDTILGGTENTTYVLENFYNKLANGTYVSSSGATYTTESYVSAIRSSRENQGISNLAAWDLGMGLVAVSAIGADTTAWIAGTKSEIDEIDSNGYYDVLGLAGSIYGLASAGLDYDPLVGQFAAADSLLDLGQILAGFQIDIGGFAWNADYVIADESNEVIQETAYAMLALNQLDASLFSLEIQGAASYLVNSQLASGGWGDYGQENNEITAEALWALNEAAPVPEPSAILLFGAGLAGLVAYRRKMKK
jgi:hypothetical protein